MARSVAVPPIPTVMKALSDPVRWKIVMQMAATEELACTTLEQTLPVTKSTISYHIKALVHAHLIDVRKEGRYYFYTLRRDVLGTVIGSLSSELAVNGTDAQKVRATEEGASQLA
jgi:DNA-binding transcriptional ArsR family regulator